MRSENNLSRTLPSAHEEHFRLQHQEMIPFVQGRLRDMKNPVILIFWLLNLFLILSVAWVIIRFPLPVFTAIGNTLLGFAFFLFLIPLHEMIHGLAYKLCGAKKVSYHAEPRKLVFYALADRFVVGYPKFMLVAFSPFLLISAGLLLLIVQGNPFWAWFGWAALVLHTSGCAGDFALASYFYENRKRQPLTYDLKAEGITVFLRTASPGPDPDNSLR